MATGMIYILAGIIVCLGIVQLVFPAFVRKVDRGFNEMNGVQTNQGDAYETARIVRGVVFIVIGLGCMFLPSLMY